MALDPYTQPFVGFYFMLFLLKTKPLPTKKENTKHKTSTTSFHSTPVVLHWFCWLSLIVPTSASRPVFAPFVRHLLLKPKSGKQTRWNWNRKKGKKESKSALQQQLKEEEEEAQHGQQKRRRLRQRNRGTPLSPIFHFTPNHIARSTHLPLDPITSKSYTHISQRIQVILHTPNFTLP